MPPNQVFNRFRSAFSRKRRASSLIKPKDSIWNRLPDSVLVKLVSLCGLEDIVSLALTCRLLHRRVFINELAISHAYISLRRHLNNDSIVISPGNDLTFISGLFPPPPPQYAVGDGHADADYSFAYLADLHRCWRTCIRLSYYLAEYTVRHHLDTDPIARPLWNSSKTEREFVYSKAVATLHEKLIYPLAYVILFLERSAEDDSGSDQLDQFFKSVEDQQAILQTAPFTDARILLSTQHCLELLCSTVRRLMHPEFPHASSESWVSLLLMRSTLERVLQFFISVAKDEEKGESPSPSHWSYRKEFMWRMREDLGQYAVTSHQASENGSTTPPTLENVFFGACHQQLLQLGAVPHSPEEPLPVLHGSAVVLKCKYCYLEESDSE